MDRQAHDYAAAMAFAQQQQQANIQQQQQQQQQFGFHPQPQPFPQQVHGAPFMAPHPSLQQQFPFPRHLPPQQQQLLHHGPHPPPHSHHPLLHLQQQQPPPAAFPPHLPPHLIPSPFVNPFDQPPPPAALPSDPELHKRIDKLVEYSVKNGPEFEAMIREKQQDNPAYSFLFGAEGHAYYRYKLWLSTRPPGPPFNPSFPPMMPLPPTPLNPNSLNPPPINAGGGTSQLHQSPFSPFYDQQHSHPFIPQSRPDYEPSTKPFKGLTGPLPSDVAAELSGVLNNLNGTKESIKGAKNWFMQRYPFAPALAEALRDRLLALDDSERQLHIIYLANDILFDSLQRQTNPHDLDNEALAFKPVLGSMLARIYHNPQNKDANQSRLQKILQFWATKEVYDPDTIYALEGEMIAGPPAKSHSVFPQDSIGNSSDTSGLTALGLSQWSTDKQRSPGPGPGPLDQEQQDKQIGPSTSNPALAASQFPPVIHPFMSSQQPVGMYPAVGQVPFGASLPVSSSAQSPSHVPPTSTSNVGEKPPPYPLFPPGLIPGMVRKMQIGSGVPYSPMSPLDIPTVIPPSTIPPSDILERVSKFFKEIGEVNPSEGSMKSSETIVGDDDYEREPPVRKGGACIPPPLNLQVDPETGTFPDGSVEQKPGSSGSGRLGLGATANPNEVSQYDDVYTSYRKQRSTSYHSSMSARAAAR